MASSETLVPGARHAVAPEGITATAWPRIERTCRNIGWRFDPWQQAVGRLILAKKADGAWASDLSILSIPRQVGKSYLLGCIIFAMCLLQPRLRVIWTSHHTATTEEMFEAMKELAQHKRVAPHIVSCTALQGSRWRIKFSNGARIDFGARERGFGRGKAKVGVLVLDEFQHISMRALSNLTPTTNTAENPLILCAGTPPSQHDNAEAFTMRRKAAIEGVSKDTVYVEFSADRDADLDDRKQWAKANPSFPKRTPERAFLLNRKILDDENFRREFMGIWDEVTKQLSPINGPLWGDSVDIGPADGTKPDALGVDMSHDREISVGACWVEAESAHLEEVWAGVDEQAAVEWVAARAGKRMPVVIDSMSPAASMIPALKAKCGKVHSGSAGDMSKGCGLLVSDLEAFRLTHADQAAVNDAREGARKRPIGTAGGWGYDRANPSVKIHPIVAVTLARLGVTLAAKKQTWAPQRLR
ncbi:MAG: terminase [Streptomycetaceae bacterium]|nr:terminase [Streptomycetaceae bacterium]